MALRPIVAGALVLAAAPAWTQWNVAPAWAQWNNEPYSYRSGGGSGMTTAYRQAYLDQQINGNRPRALLRAADGSLLSVTERDQQAFVTTPQPNYLVTRNGTAAGVSFGAGGFGIAASPIDGWVAQLDDLRPLQ